MAENIVGYIDFGISGVLSRYSRRHLVEMTLAYTRGDTDAMCNSFFRISTFAENADVRGFRERLKELAVGWYGDDVTQSRLRKSISNVMLDLLILSRQKGVWPQRDVVKYIRSAIALDGLINTFSPNMDIGGHLELACVRNLQWEALRSLISADTLNSLVGSSARLIRDGFLRSSSMLKQAGAAPSLTPSTFDNQRPAQRTSSLAHVPYLLWIGLCIASVFYFSRGGMIHGISAGTLLMWAVLSALIWGTVRYLRLI